MLKIRLRRVGKKNQPSYRIVVVEHTAPVQGSYLELLGSYNPRASVFKVNNDRVLHWLNHGAQPSERMAKLLKSAGVEHKLIVLPDYDRKPKHPPKKAPAVAATPAPAAAAPTEVVKPTEEAAPEVTETTEAPVETLTQSDETPKTEAEAGSTPQAEAVSQPEEK